MLFHGSVCLSGSGQVCAFGVRRQTTLMCAWSSRRISPAENHQPLIVPEKAARNSREKQALENSHFPARWLVPGVSATRVPVAERREPPGTVWADLGMTTLGRQVIKKR